MAFSGALSGRAAAQEAELVRKGAHVLDGPGTEPFEDRNELEPHACPQKARVPVGRVDRVWDVVSGDMRLHVTPAGAEHGADLLSVLEGHHGEASGPRATQKTHEQRLGAVVRVVAGGHASGTDPRRGRDQGLPPGGSRSRLEIAAGCERHAAAPLRGASRVRYF